jgi:hypothetical protein
MSLQMFVQTPDPWVLDMDPASGFCLDFRIFEENQRSNKRRLKG